MDLSKIDQIVEEAIRIEPMMEIEASFKDEVINRIRKNKRKEIIKVYALIFLVIIFLVGIGMGMLLFFKVQIAVKEIGPIIPIAVLLGAMIVLIQYLDKKLLKDRLVNSMV